MRRGGPQEARGRRGAGASGPKGSRYGLVFLSSRTHIPHRGWRDGGDLRPFLFTASFAGQHAKTSDYESWNLYIWSLINEALLRLHRKTLGVRARRPLRFAHSLARPPLRRRQVSCHDASARASSTSLRRLTRSNHFSRLTRTLVPCCGTTSLHAHQPSLLAPEFAKRGGGTLLNHLLEPCYLMASSIYRTRI